MTLNSSNEQLSVLMDETVSSVDDNVVIRNGIDTDAGKDIFERTSRFFQKAREKDQLYEEQEECDDGGKLIDTITISTRNLDWKKDKQDNPCSINSEFEILNTLGGGGMGTVYTALQKSIDREVALKMISPNLVVDEDSQEAFLREAVVTGNLNHPNIVSVHDLGKNGEGCLFYTMQKIIGISWDKIIKKNSEEENLEILNKVCDAIAYAHSKGVIHRDLKPQNIMLGEFGEVMVADWGVAVCAGNHELGSKAMKLTKDSDIEGTPAYMPPEMLDPDVSKIGPRSDIYLLGAILYEFVTGLRPHKITARNMLHNIRYNIIQPTDITGELIDIAMKAMATKRDNRYASVKEFQAALKNYMIHRESIKLTQSADDNFEQACISGDYQLYASAGYGYREALRLWIDNIKAQNGLRIMTTSYAEKAFGNGDFDLALSILDGNNERHRPLISKILNEKTKRDKRIKRLKTLSVSFVAFLIFIVVVLAGSYVWISDARNYALQEEARAKKLLVQKEQENYYNVISLAANNLRLLNQRRARSVLDHASGNLRNIEWLILSAVADPVRKILKAHDDSVSSLDVSSDGKIMVSGGREGAVKIWEAGSGRLLHTVNFRSPIQRVKISPDNKSLLVVRSDRFISLVQVRSGQVFRTLSSPKENILTADYMPDGQRIVFGTQDGELAMFDVARGTLNRLIKAHDDAISALICYPDGKRVVSASWDNTIKVWNLDTWKPIITLKGHDSYIAALAIAPESGLIASGGGDKVVNLWREGDGEKLLSIKQNSGSVNSLDFSPDGSLLLAVCGNQAEILSVKNGRNLKNYQLARGVNIYSGKFINGGRGIVTGDGSNQVIFWDAQNRLDGETAKIPGDEKLNMLAASDKLGIIVYRENGKDMKVRFKDSEIPQKLTGHNAKVNSVVFVGDTSKLVSASNDTTVRLWDIITGKLLHTYTGHSKYVSSVVVSPDKRNILSGSWDGTIKLWDIESGKNLITIAAHEEPVIGVAISPDGKDAVSCCSDGTAKIWNLNSGEMRCVLKGHTAQVNCAVFTNDGKRIITSSDDGTTKFWDTNGREIMSLNSGTVPFTNIGFSNDGKIIELLSYPGNLSRRWFMAQR